MGKIEKLKEREAAGEIKFFEIEEPALCDFNKNQEIKEVKKHLHVSYYDIEYKGFVRICYGVCS